MAMIVYDDTAQTYVAVELPRHVVKKHIKNYRELDNYQRKDTTMDFTQYLIWETECDINPDLVTEIIASQIPEVSAKQ